MLRLALIPILLSLALAQEVAERPDVTTRRPYTKSQCAAYLMKWCSDMTYPQSTTSMTVNRTMVSNNGANSNSMLCVSSNRGTNCTRNGAPWLLCTPTKEFHYKGQLIVPDGKVDDDICESREIAFNNMGLGGVKFDFTVISDAMQQINKQLQLGNVKFEGTGISDAMQQQINKQMKEFHVQLGQFGQRLFNTQKTCSTCFLGLVNITTKMIVPTNREN